ncbi:MAG: HD domain-containing protein, partial [candidate division Zixibacteria bacterium]|nr:HD domain-containing protein [candidate division Zixibacteria bacterium]
MEQSLLTKLNPDHLIENKILTFELYYSNGDEVELLRPINSKVTDDFLAEITNELREQLYIKKSDIGNLQNYLERSLSSALRDNSQRLEEKLRILIDTSRTFIENIFESPKDNEAIKRCYRMVEKITHFLAKEETAIKDFQMVIPHDLSLHNHTLNVIMLSLSLGLRAKLNDDERLLTLGMGALLHDIGMRAVPAHIKNKQENLTDKEYAIIKKHVIWGITILKETGFISESILKIVGDHHERNNGTGYPNMKRSKE